MFFVLGKRNKPTPIHGRTYRRKLVGVVLYPQAPWVEVRKSLRKYKFKSNREHDRYYKYPANMTVNNDGLKDIKNHQEENIG